jgi:hypothetical protein
VTTEASGGAARVFTNWPIYVLAITGPVGFILNQDAFQQGRFLAPVQAILTTTDPIISIGLSILWLGSRLQSSPGAIAGVVISLLVMTAGIVITAHRAPQAPKDRDMNDSSHPPVPKQGAEPRRAAAGQDLPEAAEVSAESTPRRGSSGGITGTSPRTPPWSPTSSACFA